MSATQGTPGLEAALGVALIAAILLLCAWHYLALGALWELHPFSACADLGAAPGTGSAGVADPGTGCARGWSAHGDGGAVGGPAEISGASPPARHAATDTGGASHPPEPAEFRGPVGAYASGGAGAPPALSGTQPSGQGSDPGGAPRGHGGGSEPALAETRDDELLPPRSLPPYTPYLQRRTTRLLLHGLELGDLPPDYEARLREALQRGGRRLAGVYVRRVDDPAPPAAPGDRDQG